MVRDKLDEPFFQLNRNKIPDEHYMKKHLKRQWKKKREIKYEQTRSYESS